MNCISNPFLAHLAIKPVFFADCAGHSGQTPPFREVMARERGAFFARARAAPMIRCFCCETRQGHNLDDCDSLVRTTCVTCRRCSILARRRRPPSQSPITSAVCKNIGLTGSARRWTVQQGKPLQNAKSAIRALRECETDEERHELRLRIRAMIPEIVESIWVCQEKHYGRVYTPAQVFLKSGAHAELMLFPGAGPSGFLADYRPVNRPDLRYEANGIDMNGNKLEPFFADIAAESVEAMMSYTPPADVPTTLKGLAKSGSRSHVAG